MNQGYAHGSSVPYQGSSSTGPMAGPSGVQGYSQYGSSGLGKKASLALPPSSITFNLP